MQHIPDQPLINVSSNSWTWQEWFKSLRRYFIRESGVSVASTTSFSVGQEFFWPVDATGGAVTVTLPAANLWLGKKYFIKKIDASGNAVTVSRAGTDTIEGSTTASLAAQYDKVLLVSDGVSTWYKG